MNSNLCDDRGCDLVHPRRYPQGNCPCLANRFATPYTVCGLPPTRVHIACTELEIRTNPRLDFTQRMCIGSILRTRYILQIRPLMVRQVGRALPLPEDVMLCVQTHGCRQWTLIYIDALGMSQQTGDERVQDNAHGQRRMETECVGMIDRLSFRCLRPSSLP